MVYLVIAVVVVTVIMVAIIKMKSNMGKERIYLSKNVASCAKMVPQKKEGYIWFSDETGCGWQKSRSSN